MIRKFALSVAMVVATLLAGLPAHAQRTVGQGVGTVVDAVNPFHSSGCYRLGATGYHWYHTCIGPRVIYQHHRLCSHGQCYYR